MFEADVSYDLARPGQNYSALIAELKQTSGWWHHPESTWLLSTPETGQAVWTRLSRHLDDGDRMLIAEISANSAGQLPQDAWDWITQHVHRLVA